MQFNQELQQYGNYYLFIIRLIPIFPFFIVNFLCGLTNISTKTFIFTTALGIIPGAAAYAIAGNSLRTASSIKDIFTMPFIIAILALIVLAIFGLWYKKTKRASSAT